jgi:hypothetical protein
MPTSSPIAAMGGMDLDSRHQVGKLELERPASRPADHLDKPHLLDAQPIRPWYHSEKERHEK